MKQPEDLSLYFIQRGLCRVRLCRNKAAPDDKYCEECALSIKDGKAFVLKIPRVNP